MTVPHPFEDREPGAEYDVGEGASFVVVHPPGEDQHAGVAERRRDELAAVTGNRGDGEVRDVRVRDRDRVGQGVGVVAESRAERDRDPMVTPSDPAHVLARFVELFVEVGHDQILTDFVS